MKAGLAGTRRRTAALLWPVTFALAAAAALALFGLNLSLSEFRSGSWWGISYGIGASFFMLAAMAFGVRRRAMGLATRLRLGSSRTWLDFHLYGGALFLLLMLMHSGFRLPSGWVTGWLWALAVWTVASGFVGLALQTWIPRALASALSVEVLYERIPELTEELRKRAEGLAAASSQPVRDLYAHVMAPHLAKPERHLRYFLDVTGGGHARLREARYLRSVLSAGEREKLAELEQVFRTKLEFDAHYTLQQALRWWLYLHVPTSVLLVAFFLIHLFSVLYY